ncbi:MAG: DMT family transporter [Ectothiorhodospiraceae bacterium]|nr:DMT family transporter [Chromatiales bacterium]MCP5153340.1 DMT family transporter [Ectothiorhodospiraceae bacterium]
MSQPSPSHAAHHHVGRGIAFMCTAALVLPFLNAGAKLLGGEYPIVEIVWARYAGHLLCMMLVFMPRRGLRLFATRRPGLHVVRSALLLASTLCYFTALRYISLPTAAAINFTSPIIVTLLAIPMLGEQVGWRRMTAVGFGFLGALVIIRPGTDAVHPAAVLVLGSASAYALYQVLTRRAAATDPADTSVTWTAVVGTLGASLVLPWHWETPHTATHAAILASLGAVAGLGHYFVVKAFQHAPASIVSPFSYAQLLGAAVLGFAIFGQLPDVWVWVGAAMIVAAGLYITYRERVRASERVRS